MNNVIDKDGVEQRIRQGRSYSYDPIRRLFLNPESGKWVHNPIIRRRIIKSDKKIYSHNQVDPILEQITSNTAELESLKYVLKVIVLKSHTRIKRGFDSMIDLPSDECPVVWINHEFFLRLLGTHYKRLLRLLEKNGILIEGYKRTAKHNYPLYRFSNPIFLANYTLEPLKCQSVDSKINGYFNWSTRYFKELDNRVRDHIINNFWTIDVKKDRFDKIWEERYWSKYLPRHPEKAHEYYSYLSKGDSIMKMIDHWNTSDATEKMMMFSVDDFGNRLHHIFTYLPSEFRGYVLDRSGKLIHFSEIDLKNSQPTIYANILVCRFGLIPNEHEFIRLAECNRIYEYVSDHLKISRDEAKVKMLTYMYCRAIDPPQREFEKLFGEPAEIAREYKTLEMNEECQPVPWKERHKILPRMMQREESKMFRDIWKELLKLDFTFLPIHDAVYIASDNNETAVYAERVIRIVLKRHLRIKFDLKNERIDNAKVKSINK